MEDRQDKILPVSGNDIRGEMKRISFLHALQASRITRHISSHEEGTMKDIKYVGDIFET